MHVVLLPGQGHERHNHPDADEILYVLSGTGEQMVDDARDLRRPPRPTVFIPKGAFHSTVNTGWEPLTILAIYAPAGAEEALKSLPDYREVPAAARHRGWYVAELQRRLDASEAEGLVEALHRNTGGRRRPGVHPPSGFARDPGDPTADSQIAARPRSRCRTARGSGGSCRRRASTLKAG